MSQETLVTRAIVAHFHGLQTLIASNEEHQHLVEQARPHYRFSITDKGLRFHHGECRRKGHWCYVGDQTLAALRDLVLEDARATLDREARERAHASLRAHELTARSDLARALGDLQGRVSAHYKQEPTHGTVTLSFRVHTPSQAQDILSKLLPLLRKAGLPRAG